MTAPERSAGCVKDTPFIPVGLQAGGLELFLGIAHTSVTCVRCYIIIPGLESLYIADLLVLLSQALAALFPCSARDICNCPPLETRALETCHGFSFSSLPLDLSSLEFLYPPICSRSLPVKISSLFILGKKRRQILLACL